MIASKPPSSDGPEHVRPEDAWSLLTTPMSENDVRQVATYIEHEMVGIDPILADPREFLILAWDRRGAEMFREALTRLSASGSPVPSHVLRDLDEWISHANPRCTCPCCGYKTLVEGPAAYDLCPVCSWEDDGSQGDDEMSISGPNGITLAEAQRRYRRHGSSSLYALARVRPPRPDEPRDVDWHPEPMPDEFDELAAFKEDFGTLLYVQVRDALDHARASRTKADIERFTGLRAALGLWTEQAQGFGIPLLDAGLPHQFDLDRDLQLDPPDHRFG